MPRKKTANEDWAPPQFAKVESALEAAQTSLQEIGGHLV